MRVAYLFMQYPIGVQPFAISDVKALEALGHRVDVYALSRKAKDHAWAAETYGLRFNAGSHPGPRTLLAPLDPRNLAITRHLLGLIIGRLWRRPKELVVSLLLLPRLVEVGALLRRDPPDVVHAFWGHFPSLMLTVAEAFFPRTHRSLALSAYDLTSHLFSLSGEIAGRADSVWTHADENRAVLERLGARPETIRVVYRGIPIDLDKETPPAKEPLTICSAANFQKEKNLDLVLRAFAVLSKRLPAARLWLIGDGTERAALEALAKELGLGDSVTFTGLLPRAALFDRMARSEAFVFLSTKVSERLPNVVKEAMLARCVCVASRTTNIEALIAHGESGYVEDNLDPRSVAARLEAVLTDPARGEIGARASAHVRAKFSAEAAMAAYAEIWRRDVEARDVKASGRSREERRGECRAL